MNHSIWKKQTNSKRRYIALFKLMQLQTHLKNPNEFASSHYLARKWVKDVFSPNELLIQDYLILAGSDPQINVRQLVNCFTAKKSSLTPANFIEEMKPDFIKYLPKNTIELRKSWWKSFLHLE
ncbi:MAG: hypothetical protein ABH803_03790 [Candidatus Micrarchaeota archaeon]